MVAVSVGTAANCSATSVDTAAWAVWVAPANAESGGGTTGAQAAVSSANRSRLARIGGRILGLCYHRFTPREILAVTQTIRLAPDLSHLTDGERTAVARLLEVGQIFQQVYELQTHAQAPAIRAQLAPGSDEATLYRLFQGPVATNLSNQEVAFAGAALPPPGKNVYPADLTRAEYDAQRRKLVESVR